MFNQLAYLLALAGRKMGQNGSGNKRYQNRHNKIWRSQSRERILMEVLKIDIGEQEHAEHSENIRTELQDFGSQQQLAYLFSHFSTNK